MSEPFTPEQAEELGKRLITLAARKRLGQQLQLQESTSLTVASLIHRTLITDPQKVAITHYERKERPCDYNPYTDHNGKNYRIEYNRHQLHHIEFYEQL